MALYATTRFSGNTGQLKRAAASLNRPSSVCNVGEKEKVSSAMGTTTETDMEDERGRAEHGGRKGKERVTYEKRERKEGREREGKEGDSKREKEKGDRIHR